LAELKPEEDDLLPGNTTLEAAEREHIIRTLRESAGREAAAKLELKRTTLQSKMRKLNIVRRDYAQLGDADGEELTAISGVPRSRVV
jgi:transcriptional regulator with GAF, ATPase, and Fis domain